MFYSLLQLIIVLIGISLLSLVESQSWAESQCQKWHYALERGTNQVVFVCVSHHEKHGLCPLEPCELGNNWTHKRTYNHFISCQSDVTCPNGFRCCPDACFGQKVCRKWRKTCQYMATTLPSPTTTFEELTTEPETTNTTEEKTTSTTEGETTATIDQETTTTTKEETTITTKPETTTVETTTEVIDIDATTNKIEETTTNEETTNSDEEMGSGNNNIGSGDDNIEPDDELRPGPSGENPPEN